VALDLMFRKVARPAFLSRPWLQAAAAGLAFFVTFLVAQWVFAEFLLTNLADNWFFAGGGRHWPFFLKIDERSRVMFWRMTHDEMNLTSALVSAGWAMLSARVGLWMGTWMTQVRR
jgi:hypothetical protein